MSKMKDVTSWSETGEFVFKGRFIPGSHMMDFIKSVTTPQKIVDERRPTGWAEFLQAFATLNLITLYCDLHRIQQFRITMLDTR